MKLPSTACLLLATTLALAAPAGSAATAEHRGQPPSLEQTLTALSEVERFVSPRVDIAAELAEDERLARTGRPAPQRFAVAAEAAISPITAGTWETLADGSSLWRARITSEDALSLNLGLDRFDLPAGAALWLHDPDGAVVQGPYTAADRNADGGLWTAIVPGDELVVELHLPESAAKQADLRITSVNRGYREIAGPRSDLKGAQGPCNIDVVCPEGDPWRDQIRSVAHITIRGAWVCTGQLLNNTAEDGRPLFLTAQHCVENSYQATTIVAYWNYESPSCGLLSDGSRTQHQSGSILLALWEYETGSDFALVELDDVPDPGFNVHYAGWDASGATPSAAVAIHHPAGGEKSISFDDDPLTKVNAYGSGSHQWRVGGWELGTTEGGSSGSCIFDSSSQLCIGTLTGGTAACSPDPPYSSVGYDIFGRMDAHWTGNGTPDSRLSDWLDPVGTGALTMTGTDPVGFPPAASFTFAPSNPETGDTVIFADTSTGSPTGWSWDFGDGGTSSTQNPVHTYSTAGTYTVTLTASNANGFSTASMEVNVVLGTSLTESYYIAAAALASGLEGAFFQTDVDINNGSDAMATYNFSWLPRGENNSSPTTSGTFTLAAGASARYENVLSEVFGLVPDAAGALAVNSNTNQLGIMSRTYDSSQPAELGTFGQAIPGLPASELIGQNDVRRITFMSENDNLRANVGCVNGANDNVPITIELYDDQGALLGTETMALSPFSNNQINQIFADHAPTNGYVDVSSIKATAAFYCYGSVLDNGSNDPTTILPQ